MSNDQPTLTVTNNMTVHQPTNEGITVNLRDWNRVKKGIGDLPTGGNGFMSAGWGFLGIAVAAAMQLISFAATKTSIDSTLITIAVAALAAGLIGAVVSFMAAHVKRSEQNAAKIKLQSEMDELLPDKLKAL